MSRRAPDALKKLGDAYGGLEKFHDEREFIFQEAQKAWSTDIVSVGRVLRAHLFVEHYLYKYLTEKKKTSPQKIEKLSFSGKIDQIDDSCDASIVSMRSFMKEFNNVRNSVAHNLNYQIVEAEFDFCKSDVNFIKYYNLAQYQIEEGDLIGVYEICSQFIAQRLNAALNAKQCLLDNLMQAVAKDAVDAYNGL